MITVVNRGKIESMINEFYASSFLADNHHPLAITKLSVAGENHFSVGGGCYDDDFDDEDYAYDFELGLCFDNHLSDTFHIKPTSAFISNDPDFMAFEWLPAKPVYVTSKADLIRLYESFVNYLETTHELCKKWHGYDALELDLMLCFVDLYDTETVEPESINEPQNVNVLFTKEHFKPEYTVIRTFNGVFRYMELPSSYADSERHIEFY